MKQNYTRRDFLEFMGKGGLAIGLASGPLSLLPSCAAFSTKSEEKIIVGKEFLSLKPSADDRLNLAKGLRYQIVASHGDALNERVRFGINNDHLHFFPMAGKIEEGILCVNHEFPLPLFINGWKKGDGKKSKEFIEKEMANVGVSMVHIRKNSAGDWEVMKGSNLHRFIDGKTPIPFSSGKSILGAKEAMGTIANCAGGFTPWGTYLTCEENYDDYYGEVKFDDSGKRSVSTHDGWNWYDQFNMPPEHYGWVVEIHPFSGSAKKLIPLGRIAHECATTAICKDGRVAVYTGDDTVNEHLYKFVSSSSNSLEKGELFVASLEKGQWISLDIEKQPLLKAKFKDQMEVLIRTREAAKIVGATPLNRPEDIEICPRTGAIYVALTNNHTKGDFYGSILKIEEKGSDHGAMTFTHSTFLTGGAQSGVACPDNLVFDKKGNLWITTDIAGAVLNTTLFASFKNNGLFFVPMTGANAGKAYLMATAPVEAEFTGPHFSPDGKTLFLSVQHPGERSKDLKSLNSHWPEGGKSIPKSAVVAISGELLDTIQGA